jgi:hypothetical protein
VTFVESCSQARSENLAAINDLVSTFETISDERRIKLAITGGQKRNKYRSSCSGNLRGSTVGLHQLPYEGRSVSRLKMANYVPGTHGVGAHARSSARVTARSQLPKAASAWKRG